MGAAPSKSGAALDALVHGGEGPWDDIKQELRRSEVTFNLALLAKKDVFYLKIFPQDSTFDAATATPAMIALEAAVRVDACLSTLDEHARAAFVDMTRWCTDHITFPGKRRPVRKIAAPFKEGPHRHATQPAIGFSLSAKAMQWMEMAAGVDAERVRTFFMLSLAARLAQHLRTTFDLAYVMRPATTFQAELCLHTRNHDAVKRGETGRSMPSVQAFRDASTAAPDAARYAQFPLHPFARVAFKKPILAPNTVDLVGCRLRWRHLAMLRGVSKAARAAGR